LPLACIVPEIIQKEIEAIKEKDCRLLQSKKLRKSFWPRLCTALYFTRDSRRAKVTLPEAIGEGTNNSIDLDKF